MKKKRGKAYIGTSNVVVPGNKTTFPEAYQSRSRLHYYATLFNTVEVNQCFYKTPLASTYEKWNTQVPVDFQFTLKLSKEITHSRNLEGDLRCADQFIKNAGGLSEKKGCLLIQFPGKISLDHFEKVERILDHLCNLDPENHWRKAVEFRNPTWYVGETWELLDEFGATVVLQDIPKAPLNNPTTRTNFIYLRFHGPKGDYRDSYSDHFLEKKTTEILEWLQNGKDVYAYFNNTIGNAFENARHLKLLVEEKLAIRNE